jgi:hypothetical protein
LLLLLLPPGRHPTRFVGYGRWWGSTAWSRW